jgi:hypothetical protein
MDPGFRRGDELNSNSLMLLTARDNRYIPGDFAKPSQKIMTRGTTP